MITKKSSLLVCMKDFFGLNVGQTLHQFRGECNELTNKDREDFASMLNGIGYDVDESSVVRAASA